MKFPMLQMLAEGKKKKAMADMAADMNLDMEVDTSMEPEIKPKKDKAPKSTDTAVIDRAAVLKFLKDTDAKTRKAIAAKLDAMVVADEETTKK